MIRCITPQTPEELAITRELFREYAQSLVIDLSFQNFEQELANLPGDYAAPYGTLIIAMYKGKAAGCCALRAITLPGYPRTAEMKRLYVRQSSRGMNIGKMLAQQVIEFATAAGYAAIVLDTLPNMTQAKKLYQNLGFEPIAPYYPNPIEGTQYLKLKLR